MHAAPAPELASILQETSAAHLSTIGPITLLDTQTLHRGLSGALVERHHFEAQTLTGPHTFSLITKQATVRERRVLSWLQQQGSARIPFVLIPDEGCDGSSLICMQDLGSDHRPTSLTPVTHAFIEQEAAGLAALHAPHMGAQEQLSWLPPFDGACAREYIEHYWFPAWKKVCAHNAFVQRFHTAIPQVEHWAVVLPDAIDTLFHQSAFCTLIHTDIHPGNELIFKEHSYLVDWQEAHYGPCFLDVPHHLHTRALAESYRLALAGAGSSFSPEEFTHGYHIAARFIGLRYIWWTLEEWLADPTQTLWVEHYLKLILQ